MKAMIFAAGLGTRLRPMTDDRPKAMVEVAGKPLLEWAILRLISFGYSQVIINVHHYGQSIVDFITQKQQFGIEIMISDERDVLLDTGGGLKKASVYFQDDRAPFLLTNVDILTDMDLQAFRNFHTKSNALVTLATRNRDTSRYLLFDQNHRLCGWKNVRTNETKISIPKDNPLNPLAFSGIQMVAPSIFSLITEEGTFSTIPLYLRLAQNHLLQGYPHDQDFWMDVGKPNELAEADLILRQNVKKILH